MTLIHQPLFTSGISVFTVLPSRHPKIWQDTDMNNVITATVVWERTPWQIWLIVPNTTFHILSVVLTFLTNKTNSFLLIFRGVDIQFRGVWAYAQERETLFLILKLPSPLCSQCSDSPGMTKAYVVRIVSVTGPPYLRVTPQMEQF